MNGSSRFPTTVLALLAGGEARRLPGKAQRLVDGVPLVVRQYRRFSPCMDVAVSLAHPLSPDVMAQLECKIIFDRYSGCGPLGAMLSCCQALCCKMVLFLPVDTPFVTTASIAALLEAHRAGDEAVVAECSGRLEPLVALYDREALLREGLPVLERENAAVYRVIQRLHARNVPLPAAQFANLNTALDWEAAFGSRSDNGTDS